MYRSIVFGTITANMSLGYIGPYVGWYYTVNIVSGTSLGFEVPIRYCRYIYEIGRYLKLCNYAFGAFRRALIWLVSFVEHEIIFCFLCRLSLVHLLLPAFSTMFLSFASLYYPMRVLTQYNVYYEIRIGVRFDYLKWILRISCWASCCVYLYMSVMHICMYLWLLRVFHF